MCELSLEIDGVMSHNRNDKAVIMQEREWIPEGGEVGGGI